MDDYTPAPDNRPERCGHMLAALRTIEISADSAAKFYATPEFHAALLTALQEISKYAREALTQDAILQTANQEDFQQWITRREATA